MKVLNIIAGCILLVFILPGACFERIEPGKIGVRRSLEGGVSEQDFEAGYHVSLPLWHSWYQLDGTLHYIEFNEGNDNGALDLRTSDKNTINIDLSVPYRIRSGEGWRIVREGYADNYSHMVKSTLSGLLREQLAQFTTSDVQDPTVRQRVADSTLPKLNEALAQYHVQATHIVIRSIRFPSQYEEKLQNKQFFIIQGQLDAAKERELAAKQETETLEKVIVKDIAVKREEWNRKIEEAKSTFELEISAINAEATRYSRQRRADADAMFDTLKAEGDLAEVKAEALGERLKAEALATKAGRTFSAIDAARRFKIGDIQLNSADPRFLYEFGSMKAWRRFFLGE